MYFFVIPRLKPSKNQSLHAARNFLLSGSRNRVEAGGLVNPLTCFLSYYHDPNSG